MFPKYDKKQFANVVTGDETWVHYFEPVRKVSNKIWATKHSKRPIIAKRSLSTTDRNPVTETRHRDQNFYPGLQD